VRSGNISTDFQPSPRNASAIWSSFSDASLLTSAASVSQPELSLSGQLLRMAEDREGAAALRHRLADRGIMALAGLWKTWRSAAGETVRSFAVITTEPNELCAPIYNRMPVILDLASSLIWLARGAGHPRWPEGDVGAPVRRPG
jgi:SOS response associated peptidase (SRAP)